MQSMSKRSVTLKHVCRCGEGWKAEYPPGSIVEPVCPNCEHKLEVVRKKSRVFESISSELVRD